MCGGVIRDFSPNIFMSTVVETRPEQAAPPGEFETYIDRRVADARNSVLLTDLATGVLLTTIVGVAVVATGVALDAWLIPGGLGGLGRVLMFLLLIGSVGYLTATRIVPLLVWKINPVFAAKAIEHGSPQLKNGLVNYLLLRTQPKSTRAAVMQALQRQTAGELSHVSRDASIDRGGLLRVAYLFAAVVVAVMAYVLLSSKPLLPTFARILAPWASISAPSRVEIVTVTPGDADVVHGEPVKITVEAANLRLDDEAFVLLSTANGRRRNQRIAMLGGEQTNIRSIEVPASGSGLLHDAKYRVAIGDAISEEYHLKVYAAPRIEVASVLYDYPEYTGLEDRTVKQQGDLKAVEGTRVTVVVEANQEIAKARLNMENAADRTLQPRQRNAAATWTMTRPAELGVQPLIASYEVQFENNKGLRNPRPVKYSYEVLADAAPEIEFIEPRSREVRVPANRSLEIELQARDPDFGLERVQLAARRGDETLHESTLLESRYEGRYARRMTISPASWGAVEGDEILLTAVASDGRTPQANEVAATPLRIRILPPETPPPGEPNEAQQQPQQQPEQGGQQQPQDQQQEQDQQPQDQGQSGQQQQGSQQQQSGQPNSDQRQPEQSEQNQQQPNDAQQQPNDGQAQQSGEQGRQGDSQGGGQQQSGQPQGDSDQNADPQQQPGSPNAQQDPSRQSGDQNQNPQDANQQPSGQSSDGESGSSQQQSPAGQSGESSGQPKSNQNQSNQPTSGEQNQQGGDPSGQGSPSPSNGSSGTDPSAEQSPVDHDGEAFERMLEHFENKRREQAQQNNSANDHRNPSGQDAAEQQRRQQESGQSSAEDQPHNGAAGQAEQQTGDEEKPLGGRPRRRSGFRRRRRPETATASRLGQSIWRRAKPIIRQSVAGTKRPKRRKPRAVRHGERPCTARSAKPSWRFIYKYKPQRRTRRPPRPVRGGAKRRRRPAS